jgi:hypothetical protein
MGGLRALNDPLEVNKERLRNNFPFYVDELGMIV